VATTPGQPHTYSGSIVSVQILPAQKPTPFLHKGCGVSCFVAICLRREAKCKSLSRLLLHRQPAKGKILKQIRTATIVVDTLGFLSALHTNNINKINLCILYIKLKK
jgi:hypothetical protein